MNWINFNDNKVQWRNYYNLNQLNSLAFGRAVWGVGLRQLACWDCGFESLRGQGCLSVVSVACSQVEVSASGWSLVQRSPTEYGVSECDRESSIMKRPWPTRGWSTMVKKNERVRVHLVGFNCVNCITVHGINNANTAADSWTQYWIYCIL